jgi:allantoin racemase
VRILYQIPGDLSAGPLGSPEIERRRALLQRWAAPDVEVEVADSPGGPLSIESHAEELLCVPPMIAALQQRPRHSDGVIIGCFGDPGLSALRELLDVPVVGPFEASFHMAAQLGARVGVITILDSVVPLLDHLVRGMGLSLRYAGASAIDVPVLEVRADPAQVADRIVHAGRDMVRRRDADVLIIGCMSLAFLEMAERTAGDIGIPMLNPAKCALKTAESLAAQHLVQSRRTYAKPRKPISTVEDRR